MQATKHTVVTVCPHFKRPALVLFYDVLRIQCITKALGNVFIRQFHTHGKMSMKPKSSQTCRKMCNSICVRCGDLDKSGRAQQYHNLTKLEPILFIFPLADFLLFLIILCRRNFPPSFFFSGPKDETTSRNCCQWGMC